MRSSVACLLVGLVATSLFLHAEALTAFGKSTGPEKEQNKPTQPKVSRGRVCNGPADCAGMPTSQCQLDKTDGKRHCLCKDGQPPVNAKCAVVPNRPGHGCSEHADCVGNAECTVHNETRKRTCQCKEGYEWHEDVDDTSCSGSGALWPCVFTVLITVVVLAVTEPRPAVRSS